MSCKLKSGCGNAGRTSYWVRLSLYYLCLRLFFLSSLGCTEFARTIEAPGDQVTGLGAPPVGDARQVLRMLVRRLDELCHFTLEFSFSLDNRAYQQLAELLLQGEEKE